MQNTDNIGNGKELDQHSIHQIHALQKASAVQVLDGSEPVYQEVLRVEITKYGSICREGWVTTGSSNQAEGQDSLMYQSIPL